ncbi:MBL fold metallo-hydrolase [Arthrobacter sp. B6]|uniref:MBL fold metallo-hydrolase n=1 Tax=Arthrobacter sp. B6 TaxID=1570137 RepID=UPI0009EDDA85
MDPSAVQDVVVTHGHYDHIGYLRLFPNASQHQLKILGCASARAVWTPGLPWLMPYVKWGN